MPKKYDPQKTEIIKRAVSDLFYYDPKTGQVFRNPEPNPPLKLRYWERNDFDLAVGNLYTYRAPKTNHVYAYLTVNVPLFSYDVDGYLNESSGHTIMVRHIVWYLNTGVWPDGNLIHRDHNPKNCRFENLIHIRPEYTYIYKRFVNDLDKERISVKVEKGRKVNANGEIKYRLNVPTFDPQKQKFVPKVTTFTTYDEAFETLYNARLNRLMWARENRLGGIDTSFYDNGMELPKTKPITPRDDAPYKVEQTVIEDDGSETPLVASMLIGVVNYLSNFRNH